MQKQFRLRDKRDFSRVYRYGKSVANFQFVLYVYKNSRSEHFRLGISASKKIGNAVVRNHVRRLVKEIIRLNPEKMANQHDFIIIVRKPAVDMSFEEMKKSLFHVIKKAQLQQLC